MAVAWSSSGRVTKSQGEGADLGVFFPIDSASYRIAFGTHSKTAEPIKMPFGMMSGLGMRNSFVQVTIFVERCLTSPTHYELQIGLVHAAACTW